MYAVTLISDPTRRNLDGALADSLRNAWGGGDAVWLSPDEAAEFRVLQMPANRWEVWQDLQSRGAVDLVVQPAEGRRKKMLLADMDSTLIQQECVDELAAEAGVGDHVAAITARAMNGELEFEAAPARTGWTCCKGLDVGVIDKVLAERITYMPGGRRPGRDDEGEWRLCRAGIGRVHGVYRRRWRQSWGLTNIGRIR